VILTAFDIDAIESRFDGWELVEFLQVPIDQIIQAALENEWINDDNISELRDFAGI
jgi:hypothetical protein